MLVSPGAEEFDPESMIDEEENEPSLPVSPEEARRIAFSRAPKPVLALTLSPPLGDPLQVAGFLQKLSGSKGILFLSIECLLTLALEITHLALGNEKTSFVNCEFNLKGEDAATILELAGFELDTAGIDEIYGNKAMLRLHFSKTS